MGQEMIFLIAKLSTPFGDEFLELGADALVDRGRRVLIQRLAPDLCGSGGGVPAAVPRPPLEVLGRGEQRPVEAFAKTLERVGGPEEMPPRPHLLMGAVGERGLVDLERAELVAELAQQLDVDDELLVAGDE